MRDVEDGYWRISPDDENSRSVVRWLKPGITIIGISSLALLSIIMVLSVGTSGAALATTRKGELASVASSADGKIASTIYLDEDGQDFGETLATALQDCQRTKKLNLSLKRIGDLDAAVLARMLPTCKDIESLNVKSNQIGDSGTQALARALPRCKDLKILKMNVNQIGDEGANALAQAISSCKNLESVHLDGNMIGDAGAQMLAQALPGCRNLKLLSLEKNQIKDFGAKSLTKAVSNCEMLETLSIKGNPMSTSVERALAQALTGRSTGEDEGQDEDEDAGKGFKSMTLNGKSKSNNPQDDWVYQPQWSDQQSAPMGRGVGKARPQMPAGFKGQSTKAMPPIPKFGKAQPGPALVPRPCAKCLKRHAVGTTDFYAQGSFFCVPCGLAKLDEYEDKDLAEAIRFLRSHACQSPEESYTHNSITGRDFTNYVGRYNFDAGDSELIQEYANAVALFHQRKMPLFHMEILGTMQPRRYCEDIDILCSTQPAKKDYDSLTERFLTLRMQVIKGAYPDIDPLLVTVFDSSGFSKKYRQWKLSIHLVWNDIVVDEERAATLRQSFVETMEGLSRIAEDNEDSLHEFELGKIAQMARSMQRELLQYGGQNTWRTVLDTSIVSGGNGLRVPLCDKRDMGVGKEGRPKQPLGTWKLDSKSNKAMKMVKREQEDDAMWVLRGLCRCPDDFPLTDWKEPKLLQPLENKKERKKQSGSYSKGGGRPKDSPDVQAWTPPPPKAPQGVGAVVIWHDGSWSKYGVSGAATISLLTDSKETSMRLFSGYVYVPVSLTPSCSEYLGFLLGLRQVAENVDVLKGREIHFIGNHKSIKQHQEGSPPLEDSASAQIVPLFNAVKELLGIIGQHSKNNPFESIHVKPTGELAVEDKMAKFALRHGASSVVDEELVKLLQESSFIWSSKTERVMTRAHLVNALSLQRGRGTGAAEASSSARPTVSKAKPATSSKLSANAAAMPAPSSKTVASSASPNSQVEGHVRLTLHKGDNMKSVLAPVDVTAKQISARYGGAGDWEVHMLVSGEYVQLFPDMRICDLKSEEPIDIMLVQDEFR